MYCITIS